MAYNAIDEREAELRARLRKVEAQIEALLDRVADASDTAVIDTDVGAAGGSVVKGSQRLQALRDERDDIRTQLAALPYESIIPIAIGTDSTGRDIGETVLS